MSARAALGAIAARATAAGGGCAIAFGFLVAFLGLTTGEGLLQAVGSPAGIALLGAAGAALLAGAAGAIAEGLRPAHLATAAVRGGAALVLLGVPASLLLRESRVHLVVEGEGLAAGQLPGVPELSAGRATILPRGPHLLSKTVELELTPAGAAPVAVATFPPTSLGPWGVTVFRFGYAPALRFTQPDGRVTGEGFVPLGTLPHDAEDASLVEWTPEPNVMMGAGTYPPKREDLVPVAPGGHVFLRIAEARVGGVRRDLRPPDAHRWLADGRLEDVVFEVLVLRGRERVFSGLVRAGARVETAIGALEIAPEVAVWVELLASRDPFVAWAAAGLALLAAGLSVRALLAIARLFRRAPGAGAGPSAGAAPGA